MQIQIPLNSIRICDPYTPIIAHSYLKVNNYLWFMNNMKCDMINFKQKEDDGQTEGVYC